MASFLDQVEVNTAITDSTKLDLGHVHITTANFMQFNPVLCKEMVPGEKTVVDMMTFSRMQPLAVPTFGRANIKERAFFVPFRTIFKGWNDFITDTPHTFALGPSQATVIINNVPLVSNLTICNLFNDDNLIFYNGEALTKTVWTQAEADFDVVTSTGDHNYRHLTEPGRQVLKVLHSLGYKPVWDVRNEEQYSAMPLLAIAKIYCDWYYPSQYVNYGSRWNDIASLFNVDTNYWTGGAIQLGVNDLVSLFDWCSYVNFDSDYFVSAWDQPNSPNVGVYSNFKVVNIDSWSQYNDVFPWPNMSTYSTPDVISNDNSRGYVTNNSDVSVGSGVVGNAPFINPIVVGNNTSVSGNTIRAIPTPISEYMLHSLHALTDYLKRHQLVGARAIDRYLARFGKALSAEKMNRSNYIGTKMVPVQIGDVMSTANTSDGLSNLGTFAGKGGAFEEGFKFEWSTDEYGYLIVISSIVPAAGNYQGLDRKVMHTTKLDFWTPEYDNLGVQAISTRELYGCGPFSTYLMSNSSNSYMGFNKNVFGFAPRYGEYKYASDQLSGDFSVRTLNNQASSDSWHLMRTFSDSSFYKASTNSYDFSYLTHSLNFCNGFRDHKQFNRIFTYVSNDDQPDPFTIIYDFNMVSHAPMKPLYDTYDFEDKGKKIREEANGVKMN